MIEIIDFCGSPTTSDKAPAGFATPPPDVESSESFLEYPQEISSRKSVTFLHQTKKNCELYAAIFSEISYSLLHDLSLTP